MARDAVAHRKRNSIVPHPIAAVSSNVDFRYWDPIAVNADEAADAGPQQSAGPQQMVGNGWEWTSTVFAPFPGFRTDAVLHQLLRALLRWSTLCAQGRIAAHRRVHAAAVVPQLVPAGVSVSLLHIPAGGVVMLAPAPENEFVRDVRAGLSGFGQKTLPCRYLYDAVGSALFEAITHPWGVRAHARRRAHSAGARRGDHRLSGRSADGGGIG
jgi:hypothetical protein